MNAYLEKRNDIHFHHKGTKIKYKCIRLECNNNVCKEGNRCEKCYRKETRKTVWPTKEILSREIWEIPAVKLAEKYQVSDSTISNWCRNYGLEKPSVGYWKKKSSESINN